MLSWLAPPENTAVFPEDDEDDDDEAQQQQEVSASSEGGGSKKSLVGKSWRASAAGRPGWRDGWRKLVHVIIHTRRHFQFWLGFAVATWAFTDHVSSRRQATPMLMAQAGRQPGR